MKAFFLHQSFNKAVRIDVGVSVGRFGSMRSVRRRYSFLARKNCMSDVKPELIPVMVGERLDLAIPNVEASPQPPTII
jgi:hypothetical protein